MKKEHNMNRRKIYFEKAADLGYGDSLLDDFIEKLQNIKETYKDSNSVSISWMTRCDGVEFSVSGYDFETEEQATDRILKDDAKKKIETQSKIEQFNKLKEELEKEGVL